MEIIRCENCKHWDHEVDTYFSCYKGMGVCYWANARMNNWGGMSYKTEQLMRLEDGDYAASPATLFTHPTFGCVCGEPK